MDLEQGQWQRPRRARTSSTGANGANGATHAGHAALLSVPPMLGRLILGGFVALEDSDTLEKLHGDDTNRS